MNKTETQSSEERKKFQLVAGNNIKWWWAGDEKSWVRTGEENRWEREDKRGGIGEVIWRETEDFLEAVRWGKDEERAIGEDEKDGVKTQNYVSVKDQGNRGENEGNGGENKGN